MFNRALTATASVMLALIIAGCSSSGGIESTYDYNREVNFTRLSTYAFIDEHPMKVSQAQGAVSPMLEGRLMESIRIAMNAKGYREVRDPEAADVVIGLVGTLLGFCLV